MKIGDKVIMVNPWYSSLMRKGDTAIIIGLATNLSRLEKLLHGVE